MGFVLCPKQGNKIEGVILNRVCIKKFLFLQGQRLKPSAARLPEYCSSSPSPPPPAINAILFIKVLFFSFFKFIQVTEKVKYFE